VIPNEPGNATVPKLTVAVPTYNRSGLLRLTLASILAQRRPDFRVVVFDNASTDDTAEVVRSFGDPRLTHDRSAVNVGLVGNWNRCIQSNRSPYLSIVHDDDLVLDGYFEESVAMFEAHPDAGFCYARAKIINHRGEVIKWPVNQDTAPAGVVSGFEFLDQMLAADRPPTIFPSAVAYRAAALAEVGGFDSAHSRLSIDLCLFYRLAARFPVARLGRELVAQRVHPGQETEAQFRSAAGLGLIGVFAEQMDAAAHLLASPRAGDPPYRRWLTERLLALHRKQSDAAHGHIPELYWNWKERLAMATEELDGVLPPAAAFALVDEDTWGWGSEFRGRRVWPFPERDGMFWGQPPTQENAVAELHRLRERGTGHIAFTWTTLWWLDHYSDMARELRTRGQCVLENSRVTVFKL